MTYPTNTNHNPNLNPNSHTNQSDTIEHTILLVIDQLLNLFSDKADKLEGIQIKIDVMSYH